MKKIVILQLLIFFIFSCGNEKTNNNSTKSASKPSATKTTQKTDDGKGVGPVKNVKLNSPLIAGMVEKGKGVYEMKCSACHKLSDQRVVGPGWKGITEKRKPEWIMNMTMNIEEMLEKDEEAKALLKECLVRMPNQNLSREDARDILEFMYSNDGQKAE